jgi:hypothetical protein
VSRRHDDLRALGLMEAVEALGANSGHTNNYTFILQVGRFSATFF